MVDFNKLRTKKTKSNISDPIEIFRRLPKPEGMNDLYTSQAEVLHSWYDNRENKDTVLKLHTGGGKTLVGLLIAQSTLNELQKPVLYLTPTIQLVNQTLEKANAIGISAVPYIKGQPLQDEFTNCNAIMVATYKALFNGLSKFGLRGKGQPIDVSAVILDDAHAAFSVVRESFTLEINSLKNRDRYESICGLFRESFKKIDKLGTFDDILSGSELSILEVPYWAWYDKLDAVREQLKTKTINEDHIFEWPLLRDQLQFCHALISKFSFTITPILPLVNMFPTFYEAPRRIYMSATIADDSEIIRTFDADPDSVKNALKSRSLAGVSERMILIPDFMKFKMNVNEAIFKILDWTSKNNLGSIILVSSDNAATKWSDVATVASGSEEVEKYVNDLQQRISNGPIVFANRYDGIDLPGDSCRLLVMNGLPTGTSTYELFRASVLYGSDTITRMLAQRIEQGIGRGARGSGDHCVVILTGSDISSWISKNNNYQFLTNPTRAQLKMGSEISKEISNLEDLGQTIKRSYERDKEWIEYHAETLAELVDDNDNNSSSFFQASIERKAMNLWQDSYSEKAITKLEKDINENKSIDEQMLGWLEQFMARISYHWGNKEKSEEIQRNAFSHNRNLIRPNILPPYRPLTVPSEQAHAIIDQISGYHIRHGFMKTFEEVVSYLHHDASSNQFEQALTNFAKMIGLTSERHDCDGEGPDVLWLLPEKIGLIIEAKSRKKAKNALTKKEHGQLLVAREWFNNYYSDYKSIMVSVHPKNLATKAAVAGASHALTYEKLAEMISDARILLNELSDSQLPKTELLHLCNDILLESNVNASNIVDKYLLKFKEVE